MWKWLGCLSKILKMTPRRYQDSVLWEWLEFVSPLRDTNTKQHCHLQFGSLYPKRYCKGFRCGSFEAEHSKAYQSRFFTPLKICTMSSPVLFVPLLGRMQQMWGAAAARTLLGLHVHRDLGNITPWEYSKPSFQSVDYVNYVLYMYATGFLLHWPGNVNTGRVEPWFQGNFMRQSAYWLTFSLTFPIIFSKI